MKAIINIALVVAAVSLILGIISRFTAIPVHIGKTGIEAQAFLQFTNTCLLVAIALILKKK
jgi:hypothetical protein